jgi:hypothetical protein|tara:strand:- start:617 stop:832 length:216 start_codon:yes stop_codon:yes gene_type:complete
MRLTNEQMVEIADYLDEILGKNFHDCVMEVVEHEIEDDEIYTIKRNLALGYLEEYRKFKKDEIYKLNHPNI